MVPLCCLLVESIEILASLSLLWTILCLHLDSCLLCQDLDRLSEVDLLDLHEEIDRSSSLATREAVGYIFGGRYDKRWRLLTMKGTESLVVDTCLLGRYISIDDIEYLDTGFDVLSDCHVGMSLLDFSGFLKNKKFPRLSVKKNVLQIRSHAEKFFRKELTCE